MRTQGLRIVLVLAALSAVALARPAAVAAHCDSMDGPVVKAAQAALEAGDANLVLQWVQAGDEAEVRSALERTLAVRGAGAAARELADTWFFETVVRLHRAGEGEPYTGLKPAGWQPPEVILAADRALHAGSADSLAGHVAAALQDEVRRRFEAARSLQGYAPGDVAAGRRYVAAYVSYTHLLEALHHALQEGHGGSAPHAGGGHD
jgi:hypothetical protein